jgi:hypothetical protein
MTALYYEEYRKFDVNYNVVKKDTTGDLDKIKEDLYGEEGDE